MTSKTVWILEFDAHRAGDFIKAEMTVHTSKRGATRKLTEHVSEMGYDASELRGPGRRVVGLDDVSAAEVTTADGLTISYSMTRLPLLK